MSMKVYESPKVVALGSVATTTLSVGGSKDGIYFDCESKCQGSPVYPPCK
jgi:hypothetical protein